MVGEWIVWVGVSDEDFQTAFTIQHTNDTIEIGAKSAHTGTHLFFAKKILNAQTT